MIIVLFGHLDVCFCFFGRIFRLYRVVFYIVVSIFEWGMDLYLLKAFGIAFVAKTCL